MVRFRIVKSNCDNGIDINFPSRDFDSLCFETANRRDMNLFCSFRSKLSSMFVWPNFCD